MATPAQVEANRKNAQKSTGPRSEQGKAAAARNALKYGIFSGQLLLPGDDVAQFDVFHFGLYQQLQPVGELERLYAERLVSAAWRLRRTLAAEGRILQRWHDSYREFRSVPDLMSQQAPAEDLERVQKQVTSLERSMDKSLAELKKLQENRPQEFTEEETLICENEPNSETAEAEVTSWARIEIVKTNPIPVVQGKEQSANNANCENEPNSSALGTDPGVETPVGGGGGAVHAPHPDDEHIT